MVDFPFPTLPELRWSVSLILWDLGGSAWCGWIYVNLLKIPIVFFCWRFLEHPNFRFWIESIVEAQLWREQQKRSTQWNLGLEIQITFRYSSQCFGYWANVGTSGWILNKHKPLERSIRNLVKPWCTSKIGSTASYRVLKGGVSRGRG